MSLGPQDAHDAVYERHLVPVSLEGLQQRGDAGKLVSRQLRPQLLDVLLV